MLSKSPWGFTILTYWRQKKVDHNSIRKEVEFINAANTKPKT
jgi:hypothetical protein